MALLQGSGGITGRGSHADRSRAHDPEFGSPPWRSLLPGSGETEPESARADLSAIAGPGDGAGQRNGGGPQGGSTADQSGDLRVERRLTISRKRDTGSRPGGTARGPDGRGPSADALEATLLRLAAAGPTLADVLDVLVHEAAALLQAPTRIALAVDGRLIWTLSSGDPDTPIGADVNVEQTACGEAWRTGLIQNVTKPPAKVISLDRPQLTAGAGATELTTDCCGAPAVLLAVPLLREGTTVPGRHAGFTRQVFAVLALIGERPNWFDDDDIEATADLAEVAGERVAALTLIGEVPESPSGPPIPEPIRALAPEQMDAVRSDAAQSEAAQSEAGQWEAGQPDAGQSEAGQWEADQPDAGQWEADQPDAGQSEAGQPNPGQREAGQPDAGQSEAGQPEPRQPLAVRTTTFHWPPFLTPSVGGMPAATTSVTVVPATRPGRGGFGGWFTRTPKTPQSRAIPGPRAETALQARAAAARAAAAASEAEVTPAVTTTASAAKKATPIVPAPAAKLPRDPESAPVGPIWARPLPREPFRAELFRSAPESGEPSRAKPVRGHPLRGEPGPNAPVSRGSVEAERAGSEPVGPEQLRSEPVLREPGQAVPSQSEPIHSEPFQSQPIGSEPIQGKSVRSEPPCLEPVRGKGRAVPGARVNGFGPAARLPRARTRTTGGTPLPLAMPAPDSMGLWQWDAVSGTCSWSSPVARLLGLAPDAELTLELVRESVAPADRGRFDVAVQAVGSGRGVAGALRLKTADGRAKHAYAWSEVRRDELGKVLGAWGGVVDVTAFEHDAAALRTGLAGLRAAQELTGLATWEWRADAGQLLWSDEMYRLAGVPAETFEPTPERWHAFVHPDDLERARRLDLDADLEAGPRQDSERVETFRLIGPGGEIRHVQSWSAASADRVVYGATIDVTRQVHDRMTLERLSATDPVTGLGNRLAFDRRMQKLLAAGTPGSSRPVGPASSVTLILLDLDRFKVVNDSLGHQVGDRLLIEVARRLVAVVPNGSVAVRMGGDEFVVVPPAGATELEVRRLASGIVEALRAPYVLPKTGELLVCPASLGVAISAGRPVTGHDLLREADIALYRAKDSGRDRYVIFDEALKARTLTRQRAERRLRTALEEDRLVMQYQPVVDFSNGRVIGAEGLVRLYDSEGSPDSHDRLIAPELFLDIAEQTGLVVEIDCWVIETAIQQLARWAGPGDDAGPWLAINLSARSMEHPRVIRRLIEAVKRGEVDRNRIKIELTEKSFIGSLPGADAGVRQLIANGVGVGIDDFGTGYSALAYLQQFDLDFMKIDRSFVSSVGEGPRGDAVVTAIVDLAHAHGMRVIAEGVESGRQARRLREIGCDFAQGFHFGRPGEADRIVRG